MPARVYRLAAPLLLGSAMAAQAVTLSTPVIQGKDVIACTVTNVGTRDATLVALEMFRLDGLPIPPQGPSCGATLAPRQSCIISTRGTSLYGFCQATGSGKLRLSVFGYIGNDVVVALPGTAN